MVQANRKDPSLLDRIPDNLLREPIDFLYAEHYRQLVVCDLIDDLALAGNRSKDSHTAGAVLDYLEHDLCHHIADEEEDLFPALRRLDPNEGIAAVLDLLSQEHAAEQIRGSAVIGALRLSPALEGASMDSSEAQILFAFAEGQRRHLAWENGIVLPLARRMLSREDLQRIGRRMARRRRIDYPE
ncbi:MAG: hemerythrin domain-containing protein [Alphaproteobacteria bacterium]